VIVPGAEHSYIKGGAERGIGGEDCREDELDEGLKAHFEEI
jgi:hypothetical protein